MQTLCKVGWIRVFCCKKCLDELFFLPEILNGFLNGFLS
jgi:hypothetical protein